MSYLKDQATRSEELTRLESVVRSSYYKRSKSLHNYPRIQSLNATFHSGSGGPRLARPLTKPVCRPLIRRNSDPSLNDSFDSSLSDIYSVANRNTRALPTGDGSLTNSWISGSNRSVIGYGGSVSGGSVLGGVSGGSTSGGSVLGGSSERSIPRRSVLGGISGASVLGGNPVGSVSGGSAAESNTMDHDGLDQLCFTMEQYSFTGGGGNRMDISDDQMDHDGLADGGQRSNAMNLYTVRNRMEITKTASIERKDSCENSVGDKTCAAESEPDGVNTKGGVSLDEREYKVCDKAKSDTTASFGCGKVVVSSTCVVALSVLLVYVASSNRLGLDSVCPIIDGARWANFTQSLDETIIGQHIAKETLFSVLSKFYGLGKRKCECKICDEITRKELHENVLVLSFNGWTGVGKTLTSEIISRELYSAVSHRIVIQLHFAVDNRGGDWESWIVGNATRCNHSLLIIDGLEKASDEFVGVLKSSLSQLRVRFKDRDVKFLIVLVGNNAGNVINKVTFDHARRGGKRDDLTLVDFERSIAGDARNAQSVVRFLDEGIIDVLVPFMPLTKQQVGACIEKDLVNRNIVPKPELVEAVLSELMFVDIIDDVQISMTGCKRVSDKVDLHVVKLGN